MQLLRFQWVFLVLFVAALTIVQAQEGHDGEAGHVHAEDEEEIILEDEPEPVPVVEVVEEPEEEEEVVEPPKDAPAPVKEEATKEEVPVPAANSGLSPLGKIKSTVSGAVTCCVDGCKGFVDKCKNISKNDMKKAAVGVVAVWGVSAGIGWLVQQNSGSPAASAPVTMAARRGGRRG
jgi:hypothetical protein